MPEESLQIAGERREAKAREKMIKDVPNRMQKFRKYQGEIRRPSLNEQCKETEEMIEM